MQADRRRLHQRAWEALPWLVNGRIADAERAELEEHLRHCADCRDEVALQQRLRDALLRQREPAGDADAGLATLWRRIDAEAAFPATGRRAGGWVRWLAAAAVLQAIALAALIGANLGGGAAPEYRTLSAATPPTAPYAIRAVFAPDLSIETLQQVLATARLRIVDGPNEIGVYTLAPPVARADARDAALAQLRADPRVRFAEPVTDSRVP